MKKWWNAYFYWNSRERKGVFYLLVLVIVSAGVNLYFRLQKPPLPKPDNEFLASALKVQRESSNNPFEEQSEGNFYRRGKDKYENRKVNRSFYTPTESFDPNGYSQSSWEKLGLSPGQAQSIKKFEEKGGFFTNKEDLKKMYVISDEFFNHIEPFLIFTEKNKYIDRPTNDRYLTQSEKVDINQADSAQLDALPGISTKMVSKILKIRSQFGGFHQIEQMLDLFGYNPEYFEKLSQKAFVGPVTLNPININYCTFQELLSVPGMKYDNVKLILNHRLKYGHFKKTEDLLTLNLAEPSLYAKIAPYLKIQ